MEIILGRGNSNKLLFRFLKVATKKYKLRMSSVDGGSLRNAIPRESFAIVAVPERYTEKFLAGVAEYEAIYKAELSAVEPDLAFFAEPTDAPKHVFKNKSQKNLINAIYACPNGVIRMSDAMPGLVETSSNLARVVSEDGVVTIQALLRSSVNTAKDDLGQAIVSTFVLAGGKVKLEGEYPGWKPNMDSSILKTMQEVYNKKYGKIPEIKAIHAGLECGLLGAVYPHWDMISFGPTIRFPHSPDEKVKIDTVQKFWDFLVETLKNVPVK
jgi:dipeptidase D